MIFSDTDFADTVAASPVKPSASPRIFSDEDFADAPSSPQGRGLVLNEADFADTPPPPSPVPQVEYGQGIPPPVPAPPTGGVEMLPTSTLGQLPGAAMDTVKSGWKGYKGLITQGVNKVIEGEVPIPGSPAATLIQKVAPDIVKRGQAAAMKEALPLGIYDGRQGEKPAETLPEKAAEFIGGGVGMGAAFATVGGGVQKVMQGIPLVSKIANSLKNVPTVQKTVMSALSNIPTFVAHGQIFTPPETELTERLKSAKASVIQGALFSTLPVLDKLGKSGKVLEWPAVFGIGMSADLGTGETMSMQDRLLNGVALLIFHGAGKVGNMNAGKTQAVEALKAYGYTSESATRLANEVAAKITLPEGTAKDVIGAVEQIPPPLPVPPELPVQPLRETGTLAERLQAKQPGSAEDAARYEQENAQTPDRVPIEKPKVLKSLADLELSDLQARNIVKLKNAGMTVEDATKAVIPEVAPEPAKQPSTMPQDQSQVPPAESPAPVPQNAPDALPVPEKGQNLDKVGERVASDTGIPLGVAKIDPTKLQENLDAGMPMTEAREKARVAQPISGTSATPKPKAPVQEPPTGVPEIAARPESVKGTDQNTGATSSVNEGFENVQPLPEKWLALPQDRKALLSSTVEVKRGQYAVLVNDPTTKRSTLVAGPLSRDEARAYRQSLLRDEPLSTPPPAPQPTKTIPQGQRPIEKKVEGTPGSGVVQSGLTRDVERLKAKGKQTPVKDTGTSPISGMTEEQFIRSNWKDVGTSQEASKQRKALKFAYKQMVQDAQRSPVKVESTPEGKTVSVPSKDKPSITGKEQKKYLLAELDKAIEGAGEGTVEPALSLGAQKDGTTVTAQYYNAESKRILERNKKAFGTVTIEVPGDGEYELLNNKAVLEAFRKRANSRLPGGRIPVPEPKEPAIEAEKKAALARVRQNAEEGGLIDTEKKAPGPGTGEGPGAAAAGGGSAKGDAPEFMGADSVGVKHSYTEEMRRRRGMQERTPTEVRHDEQLDAEASAKYADNPMVGRDLIDAFKADPRKAPTDLESVILERETVMAEQEANAARSANDQSRMDVAEKRIDDIYTILEQAGSESGRALRARRFMMDSDFNILRMEYKMKQAQDGKPLSADQKAEVAKIKADYDVKKAALDAEISRLTEESKAKDEMLAKSTANADFEKLVRDVFLEPVKKRTFSKRLIDLGQSRIDAATARMKARTARVGAGLDPTVLADMADLGFGYIVKGAGEFGEWSAKMRESFRGIPIEMELRKTYENALKEVRAELGNDSVADIVSKAKDASAATKEPAMNDRTIKQLFRAQVEAGVKTLDEAVTKVHDIVVKERPEMTPEMVRDEFSDYGKRKMPSKDATSRTMSDLRRQAQLVASIERVANQLAPLKTGLQRDKPSQVARDLQKKLNVMMKEAGIETVDPETQLTNSLNAIKSRLENQIADLDKAIKTNERMVVDKSTTPYDAEAKALEKRRDTLRETYDAMFPKLPLTDKQRLDIAIKSAERNLHEWEQRVKDAKMGVFRGPKKMEQLPKSTTLDSIKAQRDAAKAEVQALKDIAFPKLTPEQVAIRAKVSRMTSAIKEMQRRMDTGDFSKRESTVVDLSGDPKAMASQAAFNQTKIDFEMAKEKARKATRTGLQATAERLGYGWQAIRNVKSSIDLSFIGRQGWYAALTHPIVTARAVSPMMQSLSKTRSAMLEQKIKEQPHYKDGTYQKAGLSLAKSDGTGEFTHIDDFKNFDIVGKIPLFGPLVKASNRAYGTTTNWIRTGLFDQLYKANGFDPKSPTYAADIKGLGELVNHWTGKGNLGGAESIAGKTLYAPSFIKASLDILSAKGTWTGTPLSRKIARQSYARLTGSIAAIIGANALYRTMLGDNDDDRKIEWDPRSNNFLNIPVGDHHSVNMIGYAKTMQVLLARVITGTTKTEKGVRNLVDQGTLFSPDSRKKAIYGNDMNDVIWNAIRSKFHPGVSTIIAGATRETYGGDPLTLASSADLVVPITPSQVPEYWRTEKPHVAALLTALATLGVDVKTDYSEDKAKKADKAKSRKSTESSYSGFSPLPGFKPLPKF